MNQTYVDQGVSYTYLTGTPSPYVAPQPKLRRTSLLMSCPDDVSRFLLPLLVTLL